MNPFDEDDDGDLSFEKNADDDHGLGPDIPVAPSVKTFGDDGDDAGGNFEGAADVDSTTLRAFVACVIYLNAAVFLISFGPMLWYFRGMTLVGPGILLLGLLAGIRCYQTYRKWQLGREDAENGDSKDGDSDDGDSKDGDSKDGDSDDGDSDDSRSDDTPQP